MPWKKRVARVHVLVSGPNAVRLITVPKFCNGTAVKMSETMIDSVDDWRLRDRIKGMCFDTFCSNIRKWLNIIDCSNGRFCSRLQTNLSGAPVLACVPSSYLQDDAFGEGV